MHSVSILNISSFHSQLLDLIMSLFHRVMTAVACVQCSCCVWGSSEPSLPLPRHIFKHEHRSDHVLQGSLSLTPSQPPAKERGASTDAGCSQRSAAGRLLKVPAVSVSQRSCFCVTAQDTMQMWHSARLQLLSKPSRFSLT